mgnify:CR=1 FL=1
MLVQPYHYIFNCMQGNELYPGCEKLNISQPAVSQHIQYMEDYYGVRLFRFIGKKLILTDAGRLLQRSLTAFHNNEIYLKEQLSFINDKKQTLRFGATLTVGDFMIARPLSDFLSKHKALISPSLWQTLRSCCRS